jgi:hypothetical protein
MIGSVLAASAAHTVDVALYGAENFYVSLLSDISLAWALSQPLFSLLFGAAVDRR